MVKGDETMEKNKAQKVRLVFACGAYVLCHADDADAERLGSGCG